MEAEGWYVDPYGRHEERWYSQGTPTALVRDAQVESHDAPPPDPPRSGSLTREQNEASDGATDLLRADDAENQEMPDAEDILIAAKGHLWPPLRRRAP
jgi:hypothetical protein